MVVEPRGTWLGSQPRASSPRSVDENTPPKIKPGNVGSQPLRVQGHPGASVSSSTKWVNGSGTQLAGKAYAPHTKSLAGSLAQAALRVLMTPQKLWPLQLGTTLSQDSLPGSPGDELISPEKQGQAAKVPGLLNKAGYWDGISGG